MKYIICLLSTFLLFGILYAGGGHNHHVLVRPDGSMWAWGSNEFGQLGTGDNSPSTSPLEIGSGNVWTQVSRGQFHNIALDEFGRIWTWGLNKRGQLGTSDFVDRNIPTMLAGLRGYTKVVAGAYHSVALKNDGSIKAWGENKVGQLGDGTNLHANSPVTIISISNVKDIAAGAQHTLAIKTDGTLHSWGSNGYGQLGSGTDRNSPAQVGMDNDWQMVGAGLQSSSALKPGGNVYVWGKNYNGQLGIGSKVNQMTPVLGGPDVDGMDAGAKHAILNSLANGTFVAGSNVFNQLGAGVEKNDIANTAPISPAMGWGLVEAGEYHNILESGNGEIYSFGRNNKGQTGVGYMSESSPLTNIFGPMSRFRNEYSIQFDGVDDYIQTSQTTGLSADDAFSLSAWVKNDNNGGTQFVLCNQLNSSPYSGFELYVGGTGEVLFSMRGTGSVTTDYIHTNTAANTITDQWHHVTLTYSGNRSANGVKIYIDGVNKNLNIVHDLLSGTGTPTNLNIGSRAGAVFYFPGYIDDISVFDHVLNDQEVSNLYNNSLASDLSMFSSSANLIGWWRMGDGDSYPTVKDHSGQSNDGTMTNMTGNAIVPTYPGFNKNAVSFDGVDDYISVGDVLNFERTDAFSISTWVKTIDSSTENVLITNQATSGVGYKTLFNGSTGSLIFEIKNTHPTNSLSVNNNTETYNDGNWHHLLFTYDGSSLASGAKIYVDGLSVSLNVASDTLTSSILNTDNLQFGVQGGGVNNFDGSQDEISIWNKELTPTEVSEIYAGNTHINLKKTSMSDNLVGWWRMGDGDVSPVIKDHSISQNDGTMVNSPTIAYAEGVSPKPFQIKIDTTQTTNATNTFILPLKTGENYNFTVEWGDGSSNIISSASFPSNGFQHAYAVDGTYTLSIYENVVGGFPTIYFNNTGDRFGLLEIVAWGTNKWKSLDNSFYGCSNMDITATDGHLANTKSVTSLQAAWNGCSSMTNFAMIDTSNVTNMSSAWFQCSSLTSFPQIDTSKVTNMDSTWYQNTSLTSFPALNTSNVLGFNSSWSGCSGLTSFPQIDTSGANSVDNGWYQCSSLTSFPMIDTSNVTNFNGAWSGCSGLTSFPQIDTSSGTLLSLAWNGCSGLTSFPLIDTSNATDLNNAWNGCVSLTSFPSISSDNVTNLQGAWMNCSSLSSFPAINTSNVTSVENAWQGCNGLTTFPALDTAKVTSFLSAWSGCSGLTSFPLISMANLTNGGLVFNGVTLSTNSYSNLIINIELYNNNNSVTFDGGFSQLTPTGDTAKQALINDHTWTITDGGLAP